MTAMRKSLCFCILAFLSPHCIVARYDRSSSSEARRLTQQETEVQYGTNTTMQNNETHNTSNSTDLGTPRTGEVWSLSLNSSASFGTPLSLSDLHTLRSEQGLVDPNGGHLFTRYTNTTIPFWISLHNQDYDATRWVIREYGYFYEQHLSACFYEILQQQQSDGPRVVIDVGGNIGWFTLLSRSAGARVFVIEPNPLNILRMEESLVLNNWDYGIGFMNKDANNSVNIIHAGVWEEETFLRFVVENANPGNAKLKLDTPAWSSYPKIPIYTLDNLTQHSDDPITLLKIDVEGQEAKVFAGATKLIASGRVKHILMEITVRGRRVHYKRAQPMLEQLIRSNYTLYKHGEFGGPNTLSNFTEDDGAAFAKTLIEFCDKKKNGPGQMNLWWKRK